jgi:hypothetical protein
MTAFFTFREVLAGGMPWIGTDSRQNLFEMVLNDPMHHFLPSVTATSSLAGLKPAL